MTVKEIGARREDAAGLSTIARHGLIMYADPAAPSSASALHERLLPRTLLWLVVVQVPTDAMPSINKAPCTISGPGSVDGSRKMSSRCSHSSTISFKRLF